MILNFKYWSLIQRHFVDNTGLQENIVAIENGQALIFFRQAWKKIHFTKSPHIKDLLVNKLQLGESVII